MKCVDRRVLLPAAALLGAAFAGCSGSGDGEAEYLLSIASPVDQQTLTLNDDLDPDTDGIQYAVRATVTNPGGVATLELRDGGDAAVQTLTLVGGEADTTVTFPAYTFVEPSAELEVRLVVDGIIEGQDTVTVLVDESGAVDPAAIAFTAPVDGAVFTDANDADPATAGLQTRVDLALTNVPIGTAVELRAEGATVATETSTGDTMTFASVTLPEGSVSLRALATVNELPVSAAIDVTVDLAELNPAIRFDAPVDGDVLTEADDVDAGRPGVQVDVVVEAVDVDAGTEVTVQVNGTTLEAGQAGADGLARFPGVSLPDGAVTLRAIMAVDGTSYRDTIGVSVERRILNPSITVTNPLDGAVLSASDDVNPDLVGLQIDIGADLVDIDDGTPVLLSLNGGGAPDAIAAGGRAVWEDVTIGLGETTIELSATVGEQEASASVTVTAELEACAVALSPVPTGGTCDVGVGTVDADPDTAGVQVAFSATSTCEAVALQIDGDTVEVATVSGGTATFAPITVTDGTFEAQAVGTSALFGGASPVYSFTVDLQAPTIAIADPVGGVFYPGVDLDTAAAGLQIEVRGTSDQPEGSAVEVLLDGAVASTTATSFDGSWVAQLTVSTTGTRSIAARTADSCGNSTESSAVAIDAYVNAPVLTLVSPVDGSSLNALADVDTATADLQARFDVTCAFPDATPFVVECRRTATLPYTQVATGSLSAGAGSATVTLAEGSHQCRARITTPFDVASTAATVLVDTLGPSVTITAPADGAQLAASTVSLQATVGGVSISEPVNGQWSLDGGALQPVTVSRRALSVDVDLGADGPHTLLVQVSDAVGNSATASVTVTLDTLPVAIVPVFPSDAQTLTEADLTVESNVLKLGSIVSLADVNAGTELCAAIGASVPTCITVDVDGDVSLPLLSVVPGANTLALSTTDPAGNTSSLNVSFTVESSRPRIEITDPVSGSSTNTTPIVVHASSDLALGASASLTNNGTEVGTATADDAGALVFVDVALTDGVNALQVTGTDGRGTGVSLESRVTYDTSLPVPSFVSPAADAVLNAAVADAAVADGFQFDVTVAAAEPNGTAATLDVTCTDGTAGNYLGSVSGGSVVFADVSLGDDTDCSLAVSVTDAAGNVGSATIAIVVDRIAPTIVWQNPANGQVLVGTQDVGAAPGLQANLRIRANNASAGQTIAVTVTSQGGAVTTATSPALATDSGVVDIAEVTLPDGVTTLSATVADAAGNVGSGSIAVTIASDLSGLFIASPAQAAVLNSASDDQAAIPGLQYDVRASVFGEFAGEQARLCVLSADTGLPACGASGYRQVATTTIGGSSAVWPDVTFGEGPQSIVGEIVLGAESVPGRNVIGFSVDTVRPVLLTLTAPSDADANGAIRASEDASAATGAQVNLALTTSGLADGRTVTITSSRPIAGTVVGTATVSGGAATLSVTLSEGTQTLTASATDPAGNPFSVDSPSLTLVVDTQAPTLTFGNPANGAVLGAAADADGAAGLQALISLATDVGPAGTVQLSTTVGGNTQTLASVPVVGTTASGTYSLPEGLVTITATVSDAAGNTTTASVTVTVDSVAPVLTVLDPAFGTTRSVTSDNDTSAAPGLQQLVTIEFSGLESGRAVEVFSSLTGGRIATFVAGSVSPASVTVTLPGSGTHGISATASDAAGNAATAVGGTIEATFDDCGIQLIGATSPLVVNVASDADGNPVNGGQVGIQFSVLNPACDGLTAEIGFDDGEGGFIPAASTTVVSSAGDFGLLTLADGDQGAFYIRIDRLPAASVSEAIAFKADLTSPSVLSAAPGESPVTILGIAESSSFGPGTVDFSVETSGAIGGTLTLTSGTTTLAEVDVLSDITVIPGLALPTGSFSIDFVAVDGADNVSNTLTFNYRTDFTAPPAPTDLGDTVTNRRRGTVELTWTGTTDDVVRYEVRSSLVAFTDEATWAAATPIGTATAQGGAITFTVDLLEPMQATHNIAVRAFDSTGNGSSFATRSVFVGLLFANLTLPQTLAFATVALGDVNDDGFDDFAFGGQSSGAGLVSVVYGAATPAGFTAVSIPSPITSGTFGSVIHAPGDVNGDGINDLVATDAAQSRVYLFLGASPALSTTPTTTITYSEAGVATPLFGRGNTTGRGNVLDITADATDDGINDLIVSATSSGTNLGRVFAIAGRTSWPSTLALTENAATNFSLGVATLSNTVVSGSYGSRMVVLGDVNEDGFDDFLVSASRSAGNTLGAVYFFYGGDLCSGPTCEFDTNARSESTRDAGPWVGNSTGALWATTYGMSGGEDLDGDGLGDAVMADIVETQVDRLLSSEPMPAALASSSTISGFAAATFRPGASLTMLGDVRLNYNAPDGAVPLSDLLMHVQHRTTSPGLDQMVLLINSGTGTFSNAPNFGYVLATGANAPSMAGDVNADGLVDFAFYLPGSTTLRIAY